MVILRKHRRQYGDDDDPTDNLLTKSKDVNVRYLSVFGQQDLIE